MRYFIFGGSGFIGSHLVDQIRKSKHDAQIYNLDIVKNDHHGKSTFIHCDVRNTINLKISVSESDVIFNLAAIHRTPGHPDHEYFETNIKGAENICLFARSMGIRKILFTSSIAPYGAGEEQKKECTLPTPNTPYGISKYVAEMIHKNWQVEDQNRSLVIVRPGVVFGKGENGNFTRLYWGIKKRRFFYPGRKDTIKAAIYVKDLVDFMLYQIRTLDSGTELFNCTFNPAFEIEQIVETMAKVTGMKAPKLSINAKMLEVTAGVIAMMGGAKLGIHPARIKKLTTSTNICGEKMSKSGYHFKYTLESALSDWYKDNDNKCLQ